jgi:hypothetical protein
MDTLHFAQQLRRVMELAVVLLFITPGIVIACPIGINGTAKTASVNYIDDLTCGRIV